MNNTSPFAQAKITMNSAPRLRVRRLDEQLLIKDSLSKSKELGRPVILCRNGGAVNNSYGYPADTEGGIAVGFPDGSYWCEVVRLPANKVTSSGVFRAVSGKVGLFDRRFSENRKKKVRKEFLESVKADLGTKK